MRRIILTGLAFGIAFGLLGNLITALVAAIVTYAVTSIDTTPTKMVMIHDFKTGETKAQPMDAQTQRYIRAMEKKEGKN